MPDNTFVAWEEPIHSSRSAGVIKLFITTPLSSLSQTQRSDVTLDVALLSGAQCGLNLKHSSASFAARSFCLILLQKQLHRFLCLRSLCGIIRTPRWRTSPSALAGGFQTKSCRKHVKVNPKCIRMCLCSSHHLIKIIHTKSWLINLECLWCIKDDLVSSSSQPLMMPR